MRQANQDKQACLRRVHVESVEHGTYQDADVSEHRLRRFVENAAYFIFKVLRGHCWGTVKIDEIPAIQNTLTEWI